MSFYEWVGAITAVISFFSLIGNVLQYVKKKEEAKNLKRLTLEHYNNYYQIARSLTRIRNDKDNYKNADLIDQYEKECNYIRGIADSARISLIDFAKVELDFSIYYQHPAYPDRTEFPDDVLMGVPPELVNKNGGK